MIAPLRTKPSFHSSSGRLSLRSTAAGSLATAGVAAHQDSWLHPWRALPQCAVAASANSRSWICFSSRPALPSSPET